MRHTILLLAATAILGCTDPLYNISQEGHPISFKAVQKAKSGTKASTTYSFDVKECGFGIIAYNTGTDTWDSSVRNHPNFMWNQQVTKPSTTWQYSPIKYWATDYSENISFFAYAPYSTSGEYGITPMPNNSQDEPYIDFVLSNPDNMTDLLAGQQIDQTGLDVNGKETGITFALSHLLSGLDCKIKVDKTSIKEYGTAATVYIKSFRLRKGPALFARGRYYFAQHTDSIGHWETQSEDLSAQDLDLSGIIDITRDPKETNNDSLSGNRGKYREVLNTSVKELFQKDKKILLIPANNNQGTLHDGDLTIVIDYDVVTLDRNLADGYCIQHNTLELPLPAGSLKSNTNYSYSIEIGANNIDIKL